jgi:ATP-dependent RNA helicase DHX29
MASLVGYSIRLESKISPNTRLTFATTGVLLRMLESSPLLEELDYLVLDEVHERGLETDLLLIVLRELLKKRPTLKLVLMSATVNARTFSEYFDNAPILNIPGRTFPVYVQYLEDAIEVTNDISEDVQASPEESETTDDHDDEEDDQPEKGMSSKGCDLKSYSRETQKRLRSMDQYRIDYSLVAKLTTAIATKGEYTTYSKAILIFMPGIGEIRRLHRILMNTDAFARGWKIHLLHSSFSTEELEQAFAIPPPGQRKIVIATNIAETGITIPDVTAVIDTCKEKIMRYNERRQLSKLSEAFISRSSAKQRRGRAARVQEGLCFHLVTKHYFENTLQEETQPEILRQGLQDPILRIKVWNTLGTAEEALGKAITPPTRKNIVRAVDRLREAGALTGSEHLTPLGQQVARLPLDVSLAKFAILGATFRCLDPIIAIISILTSKSPFVNEMAAKQFARSDSDLLASLSAYQGWKRAKLHGSSFEFCRKHFLNEYTLGQIDEQKIQLLVYLVDGGQIVLTPEERTALNRARTNSVNRMNVYEIPTRFNIPVSDNLLLSLISMAFYPRILAKEGRGWRNVYTNQQVSLAKRSVNDGSRSVKYLCFSEAMQAKPGNLNVYETSRVPEAALALLLGQGEMKIYSGVLLIDAGKIRLSVANWKQAIAIKKMRAALNAMLDRSYRRPGRPLLEGDQKWMDLFVEMMKTKEAEIV